MPNPFLREEIPFTQSRLKSLIKIYATFGGYVPDPDTPQALPDLSGLELIGAVTKVEVKTPRGMTERRELNYDTLGKILEMVPGLVSFDCNFSYVMLYKSSFMEACGFAGHRLEYQTRPILFQLELPSPTPDTIPPRNIILQDCWLKDNPMAFDVSSNDDLRIIQDIGVGVGGLTEVRGS